MSNTKEVRFPLDTAGGQAIVNGRTTRFLYKKGGLKLFDLSMADIVLLYQKGAFERPVQVVVNGLSIEGAQALLEQLANPLTKAKVSEPVESVPLAPARPVEAAAVRYRSMLFKECIDETGPISDEDRLSVAEAIRETLRSKVISQEDGSVLVRGLERRERLVTPPIPDAPEVLVEPPVAVTAPPAPLPEPPAASVMPEQAQEVIHEAAAGALQEPPAPAPTNGTSDAAKTATKRPRTKTKIQPAPDAGAVPVISLPATPEPALVEPEPAGTEPAPERTAVVKLVESDPVPVTIATSVSLVPVIDASAPIDIVPNLTPEEAALQQQLHAPSCKGLRPAVEVCVAAGYRTVPSIIEIFQKLKPSSSFFGSAVADREQRVAGVLATLLQGQGSLL